MWFEPEVKEVWWYGIAKYFLKFGPIPRHIAFIMDGNRRYARKQRYSSFTEGHRKGFQQLTRVMQWCRDFGVKEVTVYAFSLENFKRNATEVADLLALFEQKLVQLLDEKDKLIENGVRIRFFGNLKHLPLRLQQLTAKIELLTSKHDSGTVNVCIAYTAQDEMRRAFVTIARGVQKGLIATTDINEGLISRCLDSCSSNDPDLLIRTSGETRLSDFLLWQCSKCYIHFDEVLWPDFDVWNLCKAIYFYQRSRIPLKQLNESCLLEEERINTGNVSEFLRWIDEERLENLRQMSEAVC